VVDEGRQQPSRHIGGDQRVPVGSGVHGLHEQVRPGVLEQEAASAGAQGAEDVLIQVERGDDHDRHRVGHVGTRQPPGHLDPVEPGHPDVDEQHVRTQPGGHLDGLYAVRGLPDDVDAGLGTEDHHQPGPHQVLVIGHDDTDAH
jgi:hypothetical protein